MSELAVLQAVRLKGRVSRDDLAATLGGDFEDVIDRLVGSGLLLDGPADAAEISRRVTEATDGAFTPPDAAAEIGIGLLAGRGLATVEDGVATLTEFGESILAWRGINSETAHAFLSRASKFAGVLQLRKELLEIGGLARTIVWSGTEEQKEKLEEAKTKILTAVTEAKQSLYRALAQD